MSLNIKTPMKAATARRTREREMIFDFVATLRRHFSADDVLFGLHRRSQRVSRATVYRTLDLLVAGGALQRLPMDQGGFLYEHHHGRKQHAHLYCLGCGALVDYPMGALGRLPQRVRREVGFEAAHLLLRVCGYCKRCGSRQRRAASKA
ncbi:MAG TPA: transcriptional repressor [Candidatus Limnocylindrales bacterium]|nr:transcriptional repressor [Candidatus Limnocylindrales bacterium]